MSTQANDRRWWSVFTLASVTIAAFIAILVCALVWLFWRPLAPVAPPTATPAATSTTAPAAPAQPVVPEPTEAAKEPTATAYNFIAMFTPTPKVYDFIAMFTPTVLPPQGQSAWGVVDADLYLVGMSYQSPNLLVHVQNKGPANLVGKVIDAQCTGVPFLRGTNPPVPGPAVYGTGGGKALDVKAWYGFIITVPVTIDTGAYYYPAIQCNLVFVGNFDPKLDNNMSVLSLP